MNSWIEIWYVIRTAYTEGTFFMKPSVFKFLLLILPPDQPSKKPHWSNQQDITKDEISTIMQCKKRFLFHNGEAWVKKENCDLYGRMGGLDSGVYELVGLFFLNQMEDVIPQECLGLYGTMTLAILIYTVQHWTGSERRSSKFSKKMS